MPIISSSLEQQIESVSKIATTASKFGVLVGAICVITYSLKINYFPQEVSVGDGILFVMAAACFGLIYAFFIASLVSLGITFSPAIRITFKFLVFGVNTFRKRKDAPVHVMAQFEWLAVLFALFAILIILELGSKDSKIYWTLPLLSVCLYFFYSLYLSCGKKIKKIESVKDTLVYTKEKENVAQLGDLGKLRSVQLSSLAAISFVPLLIGGVSGQLLDAAMRSAHIRIEKPIVYVKEPYSVLLPKSLISKGRISPKDFTVFEGVVVLFKGFGKSTIIAFTDGTITKKLEVPNDQIIVVDH